MERGGECVFTDFGSRLARIREFMNAREELVREYNDEIPDDRAKAVSDTFSDISNDSPTLFKKLSEYPSKHKQELDGMLFQFEKVILGEQSQEAASEVVGQMVFDAALRRSQGGQSEP